MPVFVWAPEEEGDWPPGAASRWWLHRSLAALADELGPRGSQLVLARGPTVRTLRALARETGANAVYWNRRFEPGLAAVEGQVEQALAAEGIETARYNSAVLFEPEAVSTQSGGPYRVFTPFWRACLALAEPGEPLAAPRALRSPKRWPRSLPLAALELEPKVDWAGGLREAWTPGSRGARRQLSRFFERAFEGYDVGRNRPDQVGTSRLSPHLHFGEMSPREVWHGLRLHADRGGLGRERWRGSQFLTELGWREFAHHLLHHFPHTGAEPLRSEFGRFPWGENREWQRAWERGRTGYPFVDAGLRELWATGWMHNRVRMVVASFLVKDLLLPWQTGARWFWDTLVDADLASNTLGWQWTAGCGADAAPYFRIFNPVSQGEKFDPEGNYVRRWVPELGRMPAKWIQAPWAAPAGVLGEAGVALGRDYPHPVVSHAIAREVALEAYTKIKGAR